MIIHGVDFSGADSGATSRIRIASRTLGSRGGESVRVERVDRNTLLRLIRASSLDGGRHLWRVNAAMGLPLEAVSKHEVALDWLEVARWMNAFGAPRPWRTAMRLTERAEPRRTADREFRTPMAPMNLRSFKQTWVFICQVLLPLAEEGQVSISPCRVVGGAACTLAEGCPSWVLRARNLPAKGYTGDSAGPKRARAGIVAALAECGILLDTRVSTEAIDEPSGELLDAVLLSTDPVERSSPEVARLEGWIC
ncbi:MAG: hypothetical protein EXS00_04430 [Phycisphaerales bacterium]|nr:hypothetical protein [Phycisphaerales bacterium]